MTLGQWFCRYVYIPLGGSRQGELRTIFNLLVVWMLTAFWHGAGWNFFCWGGLLWICIVLERQLGRLKFVHKMKVLPHIYLWLVIPMSWMCFAITDLSQLQVYLDKMLWLVPASAAVTRMPGRHSVPMEDCFWSPDWPAHRSLRSCTISGRISCR